MNVTYELNEAEIKLAISEYIKNHSGQFVYPKDVYLRCERDDRTSSMIFACKANYIDKDNNGNLYR